MDEKNQWYRITTKENCIKGETDKAYLFKIENADTLFWFPKKLVRTLRRGEVMLLIPEDMRFRLHKNGSGRYSKFKKVWEHECDCFELLDRYTGDVKDEQIEVEEEKAA